VQDAKRPDARDEWERDMDGRMGATYGLHAPCVVLPREYELIDSAGGLSMRLEVCP
jgi:hypothetical protein